MTFLDLDWRSAITFEFGSFYHHPKKVTKTCYRYVFLYMSTVFLLELHDWGQQKKCQRCTAPTQPTLINHLSKKRPFAPGRKNCDSLPATFGSKSLPMGKSQMTYVAFSIFILILVDLSSLSIRQRSAFKIFDGSILPCGEDSTLFLYSVCASLH